MEYKRHCEIIEMVKEITIASVSNCDVPANLVGGRAIADFMHAIYEVLIEFEENQITSEPLKEK